MRTKDSLMIGQATYDEVLKLKAYALAKAPGMTQDMIQGDNKRAAQLVSYYDKLCRNVGLDTMLVVCQTWHETATWSSAWFQAPRRNPAGIGVNGNTSPIWLPGYQKLTSGKWGKGKAYPSYAVAAMAHVYGLAMWCGVNPEPALLDKRYASYMYKPPKAAQGSVTTVAQLGYAHNPKKIGWAYKGESYGQKIAELATRIA